MNKKYLLAYLLVVAIIISVLVFVPNIGDFVKMMLFTLIVILTSIYTYSTRKKT